MHRGVRPKQALHGQPRGADRSQGHVDREWHGRDCAEALYKSRPDLAEIVRQRYADDAKLLGYAWPRHVDPLPRTIRPAEDTILNQGKDCTCTVDPVAVPALAERPAPTTPRQETRFLFLLGYPHTGTSAMQYLLSTSASVSGILGNASRLGPSKEGMAHFPGGRPRGRWDADFPQRWEKDFAAQAERLYLEKTLPGKLFVENSPPEIYLPHQLTSTFSKHGKVRFILLVHGICGRDFCAFGACAGIEKRMNIKLNDNN